MNSRQTDEKNGWRRLDRPGIFGKKRNQKIHELNDKYGEGNWELRWVSPVFPDGLSFFEACVVFYETAYFLWLRERPKDVDFICSYGECIDNAATNIQSKLDYCKQEADSTHIQDIAIRNTLGLLGRRFEGPKNKILIIRSDDPDGYKFGPGNVPFFDPTAIKQPSLKPRWANPRSVEDFWQSNKYIYVNDEAARRIDNAASSGRKPSSVNTDTAHGQ